VRNIKGGREPVVLTDELADIPDDTLVVYS